MHNGTLRKPIPEELLGTAVLDQTGEFEAGSYQSFTLTYTAGRFGIDDSGSIRIVFRFATDQTNPQFDAPTEPGFTEVVASNNAVLRVRFDPKGNIRPYITLWVKADPKNGIVGGDYFSKTWFCRGIELWVCLVSCKTKNNPNTTTVINAKSTSWSIWH